MVRKFESGATRDTSNGKFEYVGFMHPLGDYSFARYMHQHRFQSDGTMRDSNNWWNGFGFETIIQSLARHVEDLKLLHLGYHVFEKRDGDNVEKKVFFECPLELPDGYEEVTIEDACNAIRFNAEAYKIENGIKTADCEETPDW